MPAKTIAAVCVGVITAVLPASAWGAETVQIPVICGTTAEMVAKAAAQGAVLVGAGPAGDAGKALGEMFLSPDGEWAFFLRLAGDVSCIFASGHYWQEIDSPPAQVGEPS